MDKLPGEGRLNQYRQTLQLQRDQQVNEKRILSSAIQAITSATVEDLADQEGALLEARVAIDKALTLRNRATGKLEASIGHLVETLSGIIDHEALDEQQRNIITILMNYRIFIQSDLPTATVILSIMDIPIFRDALIAIEPTRRNDIFRAIDEIRK